jgi:osmotically-inducible protein OsmY
MSDDWYAEDDGVVAAENRLSPHRASPQPSANPIMKMKLHYLLISSLIATTSVALFASSDTDSKIENAAKASYNYRTVLDGKVTVKVNEGVVTLTGVVGDSSLKSVAEDTVSDLPGVVSVDDQITLDPALKEHSDAWIALKLHTQLLVRSNVSYADTKIVVNDGVVTLTGTADSQAQKELTGVYAKEIDWVKSVKNDIVVNEKPKMGETMGEKIDDASITSQVKYALLTHKSTSALKTKITTTDGVVVITGEAANDAEKSLVGKLAESIRGVKSVDNNMTVKI